MKSIWRWAIVAGIGTLCIAGSAEMICWAHTVPYPWAFGFGVIAAYFLVIGTICIGVGITALKE